LNQFVVIFVSASCSFGLIQVKDNVKLFVLSNNSTVAFCVAVWIEGVQSVLQDMMTSQLSSSRWW